MSIADRLKIIAEENELSLRKLSVSIGKTEGYISVSLRKKTEVGSDALANILHKYPQYNIEWVLTGEGEKLKKDVKTEHYTAEDEENYKKEHKPVPEQLSKKEFLEFVQKQDKRITEINKNLKAIEMKVGGLIGLSEIDSELIIAMRKISKVKSKP